MKKPIVLLLVLVPVALQLAACGGDDETTATATTSGGGAETGGVETIEVAAAPDNTIAFEQSTLEAPVGLSTFVLNNPAQIVHDFCVESDEFGLGCTDQIAEGSSDVSITLEKGEYTFYCSVAGHRADGMEGTLTVE